MTDQHLTDLLPDLVRGTEPWTEAARAHLATCAECAGELAMLETIHAEHETRPVTLDVEAITAGVLAGLRAPETPVIALADHPRARARGGALRWVAGLAAAAAIAVAFASQRPTAGTPADDADVARRSGNVLPELERLETWELEILLASVEPTTSTDDAEALGELPRLGDLDDTELEQLLETMEG
ncbi:MAG TPA: hypothetical protein VFN90_07450 [Gemmatimonadales bacterium]|nr:hypothetical protein [Gemmatimonadales bacterium]